MDHNVHERFGKIIERTGIRPQRALEVGGRLTDHSLLRFPTVADAERYCINLEPLEDKDGIRGITGNANDMPMFTDDYFDLVISNATFEHDPYFWRSLAEMRRVLAPGGLLIIGVPGLVRGKHGSIEGLPPSSTLTYRLHMKYDYYRFTPLAVQNVFFEGFERVRVATMLTPPRLIGRGWKPKSAAKDARRGRRENRLVGAVRQRAASRGAR